MVYGSRQMMLVMITALAPPGCTSKLALNPDDAVQVPGQRTMLAATVEDNATLAFRPAFGNVAVTFYVNGDRMGKVISGPDGRAVLKCDLAGVTADEFEARAVVDGKLIQTRGPIYRWDAGKTTLAVDIDETISHTNYSDLFIADFDNNSAPLAGAADVLTELSRDYNIVYISARPRFLYQKTVKWLEVHGFPAGPVLHALRFEACFQQTRYKQEMLARLRKQVPNVLIGIGDKAVDDKAYGENQMLAVIIDSRSATSYSEHCLKVRDWAAAREVFRSYRQHLCRPDELAAAIERTELKLRPWLEGVVTQQDAIQQVVFTSEEAPVVPEPAAKSPGL